MRRLRREPSSWCPFPRACCEEAQSLDARMRQPKPVHAIENRFNVVSQDRQRDASNTANLADGARIVRGNLGSRRGEPLCAAATARHTQDLARSRGGQNCRTSGSGFALRRRASAARRHERLGARAVAPRRDRLRAPARTQGARARAAFSSRCGRCARTRTGTPRRPGRPFFAGDSAGARADHFRDSRREAERCDRESGRVEPRLAVGSRTSHQRRERDQRSAARRSSPSILWIRKRSAGPKVPCF